MKRWKIIVLVAILFMPPLWPSLLFIYGMWAVHKSPMTHGKRRKNRTVIVI